MRLRALFPTIVLAMTPFTGAMAEPQILGVIAQTDPMPMTCTAGTCVAELTAFCMEPDRASPRHETAYKPFEGADLTIVATAADGAEVRIPAAKVATFTSVRGYAAVRVAVSEAKLAELGVERAAVHVGARVTMMPQWDRYMRRPHEQEEVDLAGTVRRVVGEKIVDNGGERADAARMLGRIINALPEKGGVDEATRHSLWQDVFDDGRLDGQDRGAVKTARSAYQTCLARDPAAQGFSMRRCLEHRHDFLIWKLNSVYWASVGRGS